MPRNLAAVMLVAGVGFLDCTLAGPRASGHLKKKRAAAPPPRKPNQTKTTPKNAQKQQQLHFSPDSAERDVQLTQRLRLYSDDDPTGARSVTVPVVTETVDELVFSEPQAAFLGRVAAASGRRPDGSIGPLPPAAALSAVQAHFPAPDEARDMAPLQEARRRVAVIAASLRNQAAAMAALAAAGG